MNRKDIVSILTRLNRATFDLLKEVEKERPDILNLIPIPEISLSVGHGHVIAVEGGNLMILDGLISFYISNNGEIDQILGTHFNLITSCQTVLYKNGVKTNPSLFKKATETLMLYCQTRTKCESVIAEQCK